MAKKVDGMVRLALVGCGGISGAHVRGLLKHAEKIRCVALCDISEEALRDKAQRLAPLNAPPRAFGDWKVMLAEMGGEIDAVDICLPHHLHAEAIIDAVGAGKHVLCEKPMCISLGEADRVAAAVAAAGVTYMSAHNQLFMPVVQEAKRMIEAGELGRVYWLRSQDCFTAAWSRAKWAWRASLKTQGGGELIDTGYHPTYRLLHLAGSPVAAVRATMGRYNNDLEGEDTASVQVRFENGAVGEVFTSWAMGLPHGTHQIHVMGERGQVFGSGDALWWLPRGFSEPCRREFAKVETFEAEIGHFADCLREGKRPPHGVEEGRAVLEVILAAGRNAEGWQATAVLKA